MPSRLKYERLETVFLGHFAQFYQTEQEFRRIYSIEGIHQFFVMRYRGLFYGYTGTNRVCNRRPRRQREREGADG